VVHTVTDARRPMSEDIGYRERRYLLSMAARTACFVLSIVLVVTLQPPWQWLAIVALAGAILLPYIAVIFANGGREPESGAHFRVHEPDSADTNEISRHRPEIRS
jgi:hypothetical protein